MPKADSSMAKDRFKLWDDDAEEKIDAAAMADVARACGCKFTQAQFNQVCGAEYKPGDKKVTVEEFLPIYEKLCSEKAPGNKFDFLEGLRVFDQDNVGKVMSAEIKHVLMALGERLNSDQAEEIIDHAGKVDEEGMVKYEDFINRVLAGPFPEEETD